MIELRKEIEPQIDKAEEIYPRILKCLLDYTKYVDENGDEENKEYQRVVAYLTQLTGKNIEESDYAIWEYWEADGEHRESFKIALPHPMIVDNLTKEELTEIVFRITSMKLPEYLKTDFIEKNGFEWEICDYYHQLLKINFKKYNYRIFNRQKDANGEWYEPSTEEIVEKIGG
ncbi:hypothetical protein AAG747_04750 [Rapidithrix thailandica]|uniref:DUF1642 domain-containing protein n=1 Tax=Rapidithrix thailandica TaxID=413964 RepID=A0AAW9S4A8_9BACT